MKKVENRWVADFESRYFTEDFPFGLRWINDQAQFHNIKCPIIDMVYQWGTTVNNNYYD